MKKYNLTVEIPDGKHIKMKGGNFTFNSTSGKALFVLEDDKPLSVCSGKNCESRLKVFFKLQSFN